MLARRRVLERCRHFSLVKERGAKRSSRKGSSKLPVILQKDADKLGKQGDRVRVEPGFARNWLIPQLLAKYDVEAKHGHRQPKSNQPGPRVKYEDGLAKQMAKLSPEQKQLHQIMHRLQASPLEIKRAAKEGDQLSKSLTNGGIVRAVARQKKIALDSRLINMEAPIKVFGTHSIPLGITLANGEIASLQVVVAR